MELRTLERLTLLSILPQEGSITDLRIVRKLRGDLSFSEAEHKLLQFKHGGETLPDGTVLPPGQIIWQVEGDQPKEIEIGKRAEQIIRDVLLDLNRKKVLREEQISVFERFCPDET